MRRPIIAGNWKMNLLISEATDLARELVGLLHTSPSAEVVVAPSFTALAAVGESLKGSNVALAGQNMCSEAKGAYTGEVSAAMLRDCGCGYVILGHSERRQYYGETDILVNQKAKAALQQELNVILCVGETLDQRERDETRQIVQSQICSGLEGLAVGDLASLVIAYEPVWAIGTGKNASPEQAQEVHQFIREMVAELYDGATAQTIRILYGGSVKPENSELLLAQPDIDGALVGNASLKAESFYAIICSAN